MKIPMFGAVRIVVAAFTCAALIGTPLAATTAQDDKKKPKVQVRASPQTGFSPVRVVVTAELKGGDDDFSEFYCPTVEFHWGDDTHAESTSDCDPYQPGKSQIRRRYTMSRKFEMPGEYRVEVRLKQKDKVVGIGGTTVRVQPGVRPCCE